MNALLKPILRLKHGSVITGSQLTCLISKFPCDATRQSIIFCFCYRDCDRKTKKKKEKKRKESRNLFDPIISSILISSREWEEKNRRKEK